VERERRHADLQPRADLTRARGVEEREEPVALHLGALAANDGRREREVDPVRRHRLANLSALVLEDVAALAVEVFHDAPPRPDRAARAGGLYLQRIGHVL